jgi:hypothetical protein
MGLERNENLTNYVRSGNEFGLNQAERARVLGAIADWFTRQEI